MAEAALFLSHSQLGRFVSLDLALAALAKVLGAQVEERIAHFAEHSEEDSCSSICSDFFYRDADGHICFAVDAFYAD